MASNTEKAYSCTTLPYCRNRMILLFWCGVLLVSNYVYFNLTKMLQLYHYATNVTSKASAPNVLQNVFSTQFRWLKAREKSNATKLFLFAYMRGGSSIAGELFNCDPSVTMWYEPGDAFFSAYYGLFQENLPQNDLYFENMTRRYLSSEEQQAMKNFYSNIFSCHYKEFPPEAMAHDFLKESSAMDSYVKCMKGKRRKNINIKACKKYIASICSSNMVEISLGARCHTVISAMKTIMVRYPNGRNESHLHTLLQDFLQDNGISISYSDSLLQFVRHGLCIEQMRSDNAKCIDIARAKCKRDTLLVVQVNRMKMEDLEPIIKSNQDMYVVHYTRDPRAIALSRHRIGFLTFDKRNRSTLREAEYLCDKMREDIRQRTILEKKYPGVFTHLTYEKLAVDPIGFATRIYGIFRKTYPSSWRKFTAKHMHGKSPGSNFGVVVQNATKTAFAWKEKIPKHQLDAINRFCADVLAALGYEIEV